jgi:2-desacetyl-2-hydroxyethyl bacteriochlorophyllide A dehydrogenase
VVEAGSEVDGISVDDRVAAMPLVFCGTCPACRRGEVEMCVEAFSPGIGYGYPGAFAEYVHVPRARLDETVFKLPSSLSFQDGALLEPLAVAVHAVARANVAPTDNVVILGLGPIGNLIGRVLAGQGVETIIGADLSEYRRDRAQEFGAKTVGEDRTPIDEAVRALLPDSEEVDVVFEVTGAPTMPQVASRLVRKSGTLVIVAVYDEAAAVDVSDFAVRQLNVLGTCAYGVEDFAEAIRLLESGKMKSADVISSTASLAELPDAMARQATGEDSIKIVIHP